MLETRQQLKQWEKADDSVPKKAKSITSAAKVMASVFWDVKGILLIDYPEKDRTITSEYYSNLLDQLEVKTCKKWPAHKSVLEMGKLG